MNSYSHILPQDDFKLGSDLFNPTPNYYTAFGE
jgi:hypothetical protein